MEQPSKLPFLKPTLEHAPEQLEDALSEVHPEDIAAVLAEELSIEQAALVVAHLPIEQAAAVLERLPEELRVTLITQLRPQTSAEMITEMSADDRADLMNELPDTLRESILSELSKFEPEVAEETRVLASYGEDTAAGIMTTEYIALGPGMSCEKAIAEVRRLAREQEPELIYTLYVVETGRLVGVLSLRDLILGEPSAPIAIYMNDGIVKVAPETDQEEVARTIAKYDLAAVPVVDESGQMLGVVTVDDVVDIVMEEADEDAQKMGGMEALDMPYLETRLGDMIRKRAGWLAVLFLGEMLTASAMSRYEDEIAKAVVLALFVPLIISSGGNSGSQAATLVIRAMAVGHVRLSDFWRIARREFVAGLALGLILATIGAIRILAWEAMFHSYGPHYRSVALVVAISLVGVVMWGTLAGSMLPFAIRKCGFDPASASAPFVATLVDVLGLVIYFTVAQIILGGVLL
ncbi:MAG TPA: magnesium transporter [Polyangiales bacterium]|jgi:magnesium transporter|nr:magnesium transporter [Polyangiales bacterium]